MKDSNDDKPVTKGELIFACQFICYSLLAVIILGGFLDGCHQRKIRNRIQAIEQRLELKPALWIIDRTGIVSGFSSWSTNVKWGTTNNGIFMEEPVYHWSNHPVVRAIIDMEKRVNPVDTNVSIRINKP